ncbi:hypothetical protein [Enterococcus rivorum]|uniref:Uncharacterized protein n=1 Tax=Enterococcus rivorum TaxID=762845 RepID=A0A1E5KZ37_9ENTE|nr:hypothetical protein [Enterococcus rivorum]MBP2097647.1 hypothetical protein [Enterococcus rivorum]OEH83088.1 hypothetical protein BCR26_02125 [Enterococcus rivorum]
MNAGNTYSIYFTDYDFAERVRLIIEDAFDGMISATKNIDMSEYHIYDISGENHTINSQNISVVTDNSIKGSGNNNSGNSSIGHNSRNSFSQNNKKESDSNSLDWLLIQQELQKVVTSIQNNDSSVKTASENALNLVKNKDSKGFIDW